MFYKRHKGIKGIKVALNNKLKNKNKIGNKKIIKKLTCVVVVTFYVVQIVDGSVLGLQGADTRETHFRNEILIM